MSDNDILQLLPEIDEISDASLRSKTAEALSLAIQRGGWTAKNIQHAPVTITWKGCSCNLIEHIRVVTQLCIANYNCLSKFYVANGAPLDWDTVVCGALLHDLGKFTEFTWSAGGVTYSENAHLMRHPLSGAVMAAQCGLPDTIVHLIATHSFEGDASVKTAESAFVRAIDDFAFKCTVFGLEK